MASFKNTMFNAGQTDNSVHFSAPLYPEVFPPDSVINIGDNDMGQITGLYTTKNALVVFKTHGVYLIKGDPLNGFFSQTFNQEVGCVAPNSITEIPGLGLAFLSHDGVYMLQGALENTGTPTNFVHLSAPIPDEIAKINFSAAINAFGTLYARDREYWLAVPKHGNDKSTLVLVYHYEAGAWSIREDFPINCMLTTRDHRGYLFFGSHDSGSDYRGVQVYSRGWQSKGEEAIDATYETVSLDFGSVYQSVQPAHVIAYTIAYGNNDLEINYKLNR